MAEKRGRGRPSKLTEARSKTICDAISTGCSVAVACGAADITRTTYHAWCVQAQSDVEAGRSTEYTDFLDSLACARDRWQVHHARNIANAGPVDWRASAHILERRFAEDWGKIDKIDAKVEHAGEVRIVIERVSGKRESPPVE